MDITRRIQWTRRLHLCFILCIIGCAPLMRIVSADPTHEGRPAFSRYSGFAENISESVVFRIGCCRCSAVGRIESLSRTEKYTSAGEFGLDDASRGRTSPSTRQTGRDKVQTVASISDRLELVSERKKANHDGVTLVPLSYQRLRTERVATNRFQECRRDALLDSLF